MSLFAELNNLMAKYKFKPKKRFSQHFVINEAILERIVGAAEIKKRDKVLEIGAGTGFLTRKLCEQCNVFAVEIDSDLCKLLKKELKQDNLKIECGDFLKMKLPRFTKVVSIPPYNISRKIMLKLLKADFNLAVLVFQDEFAKKLIAEPGFPQYSAVSVLCQYRMHPKIIDSVSSASFFPKPKTRSAIVKLTPIERKKTAMDNDLFFQFVVELFRHRKKNVENALLCCNKFIEKRFGMGSKDAIKALKGFNLKKKVDFIGIEMFVDMFNAVYTYGSTE